MNLWLLATASFVTGLFLVVLCERFLRTRPVARTVAGIALVFVAYIVVAGVLVAFNLFQLDRIDPFFTTTRWHVFRILYWPSWVLTFAPTVIFGSLIAVAFGMQPNRRLVALVLLLLITSIALEVVFLLNVGVLCTVSVQVIVLGLFAGGVYKSSRPTRPCEPEN
jgi:hypothetical protein